MHTAQMTLNYIFISCMSDFPLPFSKLRAQRRTVNTLLLSFTTYQKRFRACGKKEIDEIVQEAEKVWIICTLLEGKCEMSAQFSPKQRGCIT